MSRMAVAAMAVAAALLLLGHAGLEAEAVFSLPDQFNEWVQPTPYLPSPVIRSTHAATALHALPLVNRVESVAGLSDMIMIFSGMICPVTMGVGSCTMLQDMWIYELTTLRWVEIVPVNSPPPGRSSASLSEVPSSDPFNPYIILMGGMLGNMTLLNDVWLFRLPTRTWTQLTPLNSQLFPPIFGHSAVCGWGLCWVGDVGCVAFV